MQAQITKKLDQNKLGWELKLLDSRQIIFLLCLLAKYKLLTKFLYPQIHFSLEGETTGRRTQEAENSIKQPQKTNSSVLRRPMPRGQKSYDRYAVGQFRSSSRPASTFLHTQQVVVQLKVQPHICFVISMRTGKKKKLISLQ